MTWGNGTTGVSGVVSAANSLVGSTASDLVGSTGVTALTNGNYVVVSRNWDNGSVVNAGAATWGNGTTGSAGSNFRRQQPGRLDGKSIKSATLA